MKTREHALPAPTRTEVFLFKTVGLLMAVGTAWAIFRIELMY